MKFTKFALLLAIALSLFSAPRLASADGWSTKGYMIIGGFHHGSAGFSSNHSVTIATDLGISGGDIEIGSQITWTWAGSSYPSILALVVSGTVDAFTVPFIGGSSAAISIFNLVMDNQTFGYSPPVLILISSPGDKSFGAASSLYAMSNGTGNADASWSVAAR